MLRSSLTYLSQADLTSEFYLIQDGHQWESPYRDRRSAGHLGKLRVPPQQVAANRAFADQLFSSYGSHTIFERNQRWPSILGDAT